MIYGINGWHYPEVLQQVKARRFEMLRMSTGLHTTAMLNMALAQGWKILLIVKDGQEVEALGSPLLSRLKGQRVELWNEPNLDVDGKIEPLVYAAMVPAFVQACHHVGADPWIGAISNLNKDGLSWLQQMMKALPSSVECGVSVHRYPAGREWHDAHPGFATRCDEVHALRKIIGTRRMGCSEFGYHTAKQLRHKWLPRWMGWRWTDAEVARNVQAEWAFWQREGAEFAVLYQLPDGPTDTAEDRFGIMRADGTFKPVAATVPRG